LVAIALAGQAAAADAARVTAHVGLQGCVKVGRWALARVDVAEDSVTAVTLEAVDPHSNAVRFPLRKQTSPSGVRFEGLFQVGRLDAVPRIIVEHADGRVEQRRLTTEGPDTESVEFVKPFRQSVVLLATLGNPAGFGSLDKVDSDNRTKAAKTSGRRESTRVRVLSYRDARLLPTDVRGYDALDVFVISGDYPLNARQDAALQKWVREGGHLIFARGSRLEPFATDAGGKAATGDARLAGWLPVTIQGQDWLRDLNGLEAFAGRRSPIIFGGQIHAARIADPQTRPDRAGTVLARGRNGPLIVRVPFGFGRVTFCGIDLHEPPVSTWDEVDALGEKLLERAVETIRSRGTRGRSQLAQSGTSDLGTQLHAILQDFPTVRRMTAFRTIGLLIVYILLIGPIDYFLVHRVLKRPRMTWITFPLLVAGATYLSIRSAEERNGNELRLNQFEVVDVDATLGSEGSGNPGEVWVHGSSWFTAYSSDSTHYDVRVRPTNLGGGPANSNQPLPEPGLCWSGVTETVYGGMYRSGGLALGQLNYTVLPERGAIDRLPIPIWSTKTFRSEWRNSVPGLVESRLTFNEDGRLTGTVKHRFNVPIDEWILVYRGMLYRFVGTESGGKNASIPPHVDYQIAAASVQQSGLMDHLTGLRFRKEGAEDDRMKTTRLEQAPYDPADKDPLKFLRSITFYQAIGGRKYTGLDNASLERMDLSGLLGMNRAVLVGRIRRPAAQVALSADGSGQPQFVTPTRLDTFVRILLPVENSAESR
jgi:hypothetical protein